MEQSQVASPPTAPQRAPVSQNTPTPNGHGSSAIVSELQGVMFENTKRHETRSIEAILEACLTLCLPEPRRENKPGDLLQRCLAAVLPICNGGSPNGPRVRAHLSQYAAVPYDERNGYMPFIFAFNRALKDLAAVECDPLPPPSSLGIMFHRNDPANDPMNVPASYDRCESPKPDVVLTALDAVRAAFPDQPGSAGWDDFAFSTAGDPPKRHFGWEDVLSSQRFELTRTKRSTLRRHYKMGDSPLCINPRPIPDSAEDPEPGEVETDETEGRKLLDSEESKAILSRTPEGGCLGKRKRDASVESRTGGLRGFRESAGVSAMLQSASYAAERMSRAFWATHIINLVIINDVAYVWYYDDQHSVQSFGINFLRDLPYFLVLLFAFQRFSFQNWGVVREVQKDKTVVELRVPSDGHTSPRCFSTWLDPPELWCLLQKQPIFDHYGPRGRRTQTLETTGSSQGPSHMTKTLEGVGTVSRFSWPQESRVLKIKTECMLRVTLFRRSYPITDLVGEEFWSAFWECFRCHLRLWQCGIHHCTISISNLMCDKTTNSGILNDFDLVQPRDHPLPSKTPWAGMAMPFMALDLLQARNPSMKREYRHDVESFAWVLLWICCTYENGEEVRERPLQAFTQPDFQATYEEKLVLHEMGNLRPTASYSNQYYCAALNILAEYNLRHFKAARKHHSNLHRNRAVPNRPELIPDELADIEANLQICREAVAYVGLHVDL